MDNTMTFTVTAYGKSVTITQPEDLNIHEFLDTCRQLAMVMEYHEESWDDAIITAAESMTDDFIQEQVDRYSVENNPLIGKKNMWTHKDGELRDYPDVANIPIASTPPQKLWVHSDGSVHPYPGVNSTPLKMSDC